MCSKIGGMILKEMLATKAIVSMNAVEPKAPFATIGALGLNAYHKKVSTGNLPRKMRE